MKRILMTLVLCAVAAYGQLPKGNTSPSPSTVTGWTKSGSTITADAGTTVEIGTTVSTSPTSATATLAADLVTNGNFSAADLSAWGAPAGWSLSSGTALHAAAGGTAAITQNVSVTSGATYQVTLTTAGRTAGTVTVTLGAVTLVLRGATTGALTNETFTKTIVAGATGSLALAFTPTDAFDGSIDDITLRRITAAGAAQFSWEDNADALWLEIRGTAAQFNTGLGYNSLKYLTSVGISNTAVGYSALSALTTGDHNTAVGESSQANSTVGDHNTSIGTDSLSAVTSGYQNTAVGATALGYLTTGFANVAVGHDSLLWMTEGTLNTGIGRDAAYHLTTGSNNVAVGYSAGAHAADGTTAITTGSNSVYIGSGVRASADAVANEIAIGYGAIGLGANSVVIGNTSITATYLRPLVYIGDNTITSNSVILKNSGYFQWSGRGSISAPADGKALFSNNAGTGYTIVQFGVAGATGPALTTTIQTNPIISVTDATGGATANLRIPSQAGTGVQYACFDANGQLTRSAAGCGS